MPDGRAWACECSHLTAFAYGLDSSKFATATLQYNYMLKRGLIHFTGPPPPGSLVYYNISPPDGHVVFSLGGGNIITTPYNPKCEALGVVYETTVDHFRNEMGWSYLPPNWNVS